MYYNGRILRNSEEDLYRYISYFRPRSTRPTDTFLKIDTRAELAVTLSIT